MIVSDTISDLDLELDVSFVLTSFIKYVSRLNLSGLVRFGWMGHKAQDNPPFVSM